MPPCPLPQPPPLPASLLHFFFYLFSQGGTVTMVTNQLGIYEEWVPWKEVFGPQGDMESLRQEPLVSSKGSSDQEWGLRDFSGCPVMRPLHFPVQGGVGSIAGQGTKIPHAAISTAKNKKRFS